MKLKRTIWMHGNHPGVVTGVREIGDGPIAELFINPDLQRVEMTYGGMFVCYERPQEEAP